MSITDVLAKFDPPTDPVLCDWCGKPLSTVCVAADHDRLNRSREQHWREQVTR